MIIRKVSRNGVACTQVGLTPSDILALVRAQIRIAKQADRHLVMLAPLEDGQPIESYDEVVHKALDDLGKQVVAPTAQEVQAVKNGGIQLP